MRTVTEPKNSESETGKTVDLTGAISAPNIQTVTFRITGTAPYVSNNFGGEARAMMRATQAEGSTAKGKKKRPPKNFEKGFQESLHKTADGRYGIPAPAFRAAMISACRIVDFKMTRAKLAVFVHADGYDAVDGTGLVLFTKGKPRHVEHFVRNESGVADIRARGMFDAGWKAALTISFDADMFTLIDIANLVKRVGIQVGVGAGRPDSKDSCGMGWGLFQIEESES